MPGCRARSMQTVAPMLDGAHTIEAIFAALSDTYPIQQVFAALDHLRNGGYLAEDAADQTRPARAFWEHVGAAPAYPKHDWDARAFPLCLSVTLTRNS